jgi:hypothetical protein
LILIENWTPLIMVPMYWNSVVVLISLWKRTSCVTKDGRVTFYGHGVKLERYGNLAWEGSIGKDHGSFG